MGDKALIPWSEVHSWSCVACGNCCRGYRVPLKPDEYAKISGAYGLDVLEFGLGKVYLKMGKDRRCVFQRPSMGRWVCTLQGTKPYACMLFPFRVYNKPLYSRGDGSAYQYGNRTYYVYMDPNCHGIVSGQPNERFLKKIVPEMIQISMGVRYKQKYTTSKYIGWSR